MHLRRIGILDPRGRVADLLQRPLLQRGFLTDRLDQSDAVGSYCREVSPAAVILDFGDGADASVRTRAIRDSGFAAPIVILADTPHPAFLLDSLRRGADDALSMQVPADTLLERLDFILTSYGISTPAPARTGTSRLQGALTPTELSIVDTLAAAAPSILSREAIMWEIRKRRIAPDDRTLDVYVSSIRRKIKLSNAAIRIETVRGKGFRYTSGDPSTRA